MPGDQEQVGIRNVDFGVHGAGGEREFSAKRATCPGKLRSRVGTATSDRLADVNGGNGGFGHRQDQAQKLFSEMRTTGIACVWDAVPAWIMDPVSANRLVITPAKGAITRVYSSGY